MILKKIILTILTIVPAIYYTYLLIFSNIDTSYFFFIYNSIIVFTLPFVLGHSYRIERDMSLNYLLLFLIYPVIYIVSFLLAQLTPLILEQILSVISILMVLKWNILILLLYKKSSIKEIDKLIKYGIYILPICLIYILVFFITRNLNSVVALDYLQHFSVTERMAQGGQLCMIPNQCSELFIQIGYTTIYHTILGFLTSFSNNNPITSIFIIDLIYPLFLGGLFFTILKNFTKDFKLVSIITLCTLLIFTNGAYETTFFIPQTLAFIFFLIALNIKRLNLKTIIKIGLILILTHFVIGTYLFILFLMKYLFINVLTQESLKIFYKYILAFAILTPIIFILISSSGFSIETAFQDQATKMIGGVTNLPYPQNIWKYIGILSGTGLFVLFSAIFQKNKANSWYLYSIIYLTTTFSFYLLEPTYATKFLIGSGLFSMILVIKYIKKIDDKYIKFLVSLLVLISLIPTYYFNKLDYLNFYMQSNNFASAASKEDIEMLRNVKKNDKGCIFVSDPLTQILVESIGGQKTARAQYIVPESRKNIFEFIQNPSEATYEGLRNIEELNRRDMCFIYSSRLHTSLKKEDVYWLFHMYSIVMDNTYKLEEADKVNEFMEKKGYSITYDDNDFIIFTKGS